MKVCNMAWLVLNLADLRPQMFCLIDYIRLFNYWNKYSKWANRGIYLILFNNYCHQAPVTIGLGLLDVCSGLPKLNTRYDFGTKLMRECGSGIRCAKSKSVPESLILLKIDRQKLIPESDQIIHPIKYRNK